MKFDFQSIGFKLWFYFILFAAILLTSLWLMQIVFLQNFYERMKTSAIAGIADIIAEQYGGEEFEVTLDRLTFRNSILVFITDTKGNVIYASDEHGGGRDRNQPAFMRRPQDIIFRPLPMGFADFLTRLNQSGSGHISYTLSEERFAGKSLIYGVRLPEAVLYISTPLEPVNSTTNILRTQLIYVTLAALWLSFIIAYFISRKFSKPITAISKQARQLATGNFNLTFDRGFCSEIDELAKTLDYTAVELSKVEKLRRELIANISHDLRTPLTMVKAYAEMIRDLSGDNREKRLTHLAVITEESERLTTLVNDILELSILQSGNVIPEFINLNLSDAVQKVVSRFEPVFAQEGYKIELAVEADQYVHGDESKLTQVLYNLIGNAMNHIGEDKVIIVSLEDLGSRVRLAVTDHGEGIAEKQLPYIWDRYYKAKQPRRSKIGTGLGLSIVKGILELHGAKFGAESRVGEGSTFWFELNK